nr:IS91 family transposase [uncultured Desulfobulbus sp.]
MKQQIELADVLRLYGEQYIRSHKVSGEQRKVMAAIQACRTSQLGGHQEVCNHCGYTRNCYNSCRNRHCPKCQTMTKEKWLEKRRQELLPCSYFHMVFTVPHVLNPLILANRRVLLSSLFTAVRDTIIASAADPQWHLVGKPGMLTILHTWSQTLINHFHIHCLIPAGVLSADGTRWISSKKNFLFPVTALAKAFKKRYLNLIEEIAGEVTPAEACTVSLQQAWEKKWIVYAKKPFAGPEQVLTYLGRYTHRIAISNHRIKAMTNDTVVFSYKDRSDNGVTKEMALPAMEFIRRFLLHVLPYRFTKIRYFGFLANNCKGKAILLIRRLLGKAMQLAQPCKESIQEMLLRLIGKDILCCPECHHGKMIYIGLLVADSG